MATSRLDMALDRAERLVRDLTGCMNIISEEIESAKKERKNLDAEMKVTDIAVFLDCSVSTVNRKLNAGQLKSKQLNDVIEFRNRR